MGNSKALVKQAELARYIKAATQAGIPVSRVEIARDGTVKIYTLAGNDDDETANPCDRLLK